MSDTTLVLATMRSRVYRELGEPAVDLPDMASGTLDEKVAQAARRILAEIGYARTGEDVKLGTFTTTADVQSYAVPDNREIVEIFWGPTGISDVPTDPYARQFANIPNSGIGTGGIYWRSDEVIAAIRRRQIESKWLWEVIAGTIYLYPVPTTAQTVRYLYYNETGSVTDLDARFEMALLYLASSFGCRVIANRVRGRGTTFTEEGINQGDRATEWDARAEHYLTEFKREIAEVLT